MCAGYLFQQDKQYDVSYDTGDKAIQCGRHVDIFKFWLMWKAKVNNKSSAQNSEKYLIYKLYVMECLFFFFYIDVCVMTIPKLTGIQALSQKRTDWLVEQC